MIKTITLGEKEVKLKSSAATNILYKKAFGEDITVELQNYTKKTKELKKMQDDITALREDETKKPEEVLEAMNALLSSETYIGATRFQEDTLPKLAYIMYLEANCDVKKIFENLGETQFLIWLLDLDKPELLEVTSEVIGLWSAGTRNLSKAKN